MPLYPSDYGFTQSCANTCIACGREAPNCCDGKMPPWGTYTRANAEYDLKLLPARQVSIRSFMREDRTSVEGIRIYRAEYEENKRRIAKAKAFLAS